MSAPASTQAPLQRLRSTAARLAELVATPLVPSDFVDLLDPLRSGSDLRARVVEVRPETRDAVTLVLKPGRGWRPHTAGQYIRIGVDVDGVRQWRAYSTTSPVRADGLVTICVKAMPDGLVSNYLVRKARPGLVLQLDQATGEFTLPATAPAKALFLTAGSGITPVMGMLRSTPLEDAVLLHSAPTAADVVFGGELRKLASDGHIRLVERHTDSDGMLGVDELEQLVPDLGERETWACGPTGMLDALEAHWAARGIADRLHTERFRARVFGGGEGGSVTFTGPVAGATVVEADGATPLLDAGEAAGLLMPSGCRMGICFGCVLPLRSGAVRDLRDGAVTTAEPGDGVKIQTCISAAAGPCDIDL